MDLAQGFLVRFPLLVERTFIIPSSTFIKNMVLNWLIVEPYVV